jgi:hypothetical protein
VSIRALTFCLSFISTRRGSSPRTAALVSANLSSASNSAR